MPERTSAGILEGSQKMTRSSAFIVACLALSIALGVAERAEAQFSAAFELIKAVKEQDYNEVRTQMMKCRCPNARNADDVPVLVIAAQGRGTEIAAYLLESGANPNISDRTTKTTALIAFAERGNSEGVALMLKAGADPDASDATGQTALMQAVRNRQVRIIPMLIEAGASIDIANYRGESALDIARNMRYRDIEKMLRDAS
ncbi:MAG: hypothetical protein Tsb008_13170 [Rhodothalassiaceae bacterium]